MDTYTIITAFHAIMIIHMTTDTITVTTIAMIMDMTIRAITITPMALAVITIIHMIKNKYNAIRTGLRRRPKWALFAV